MKLADDLVLPTYEPAELDLQGKEVVLDLIPLFFVAFVVRGTVVLTYCSGRINDLKSVVNYFVEAIDNSGLQRDTVLLVSLGRPRVSLGMRSL